MEIQFIGEHLWIGKVGELFVVLAFVSALFSTIGYFLASSNRKDSDSWKIIARSGYYLHALSVWGIIATLFFMISQHMFEFHYVYYHSNKELPFKYMFSCFWEGQEGSFLLWMFWHSVIGIVLLRFEKRMEAPVMAVFTSAQVFLTSMLLGVYVFDYKFGSNPFTLLREHPDMANLPFIKVPNYLENIDGRGLNPLLQNYWMTIHPPTLFLGFALTLVPFAYAIAGLWKKSYEDWIKPALPWTFVGISVLGVGILMGGAWAYESLSFGGFWAWDPVENASLVPWLVLVGASHIIMLYNKSKSSLSAGILFTVLSFILVLYSTFLTRSGILGETSVHAFTDLGMSGQLLVYLLFYLFLALFLLFIRRKELPKTDKEEAFMSREFWMFIGALVLFISAIQITFTTSIPVINKIFDFEKKIAPPADAISHYNSWQLPLALIIALVMGIGQFLKYKKDDFKELSKKLLWSVIISTIVSLTILFVFSFKYALHFAFFFASCFALVSNADYWIRTLKLKVKHGGASIAHAGFALILMGVLISTSKKQIISQNTSGISVEKLGKEYSNNENILLSMGDTLQMGDYFVTYKSKTKEGIYIKHEIVYLSKTGNNYQQEFTLFPVIQLNDRMGNVAEPDTRHYLHKDVYTHITYAEIEDVSKSDKEWNSTEYKEKSISDTIFTTNAIIVLDSINKSVDKATNKLLPEDLAIGLVFKIYDVNNNIYTKEALFVIRDSYLYPLETNLDELGLKLAFNKVNPENGKLDITIKEKKKLKKEFIVMKAIVFPAINILWLGCIVMAIGTLMAAWQRFAKYKTKG